MISKHNLIKAAWRIDDKIKTIKEKNLQKKLLDTLYNKIAREEEKEAKKVYRFNNKGRLGIYAKEALKTSLGKEIGSDHACFIKNRRVFWNK